MTKLLTVWVTYGVMIEVPSKCDPDNNDADWLTVKEMAVNKMWSAGIDEVISESNIETEEEEN